MVRSGREARGRLRVEVGGWRPNPRPRAAAPFFFALALVVAGVAYRNVRSGRADLRGAWRVALYMGSTFLALSLAGAHGPRADLLLYDLAIPLSVWAGALAACFYAALEPWVRRLWPEALITWSRVLAGRWRDPVVARDVLFAVLAAIAVTCCRAAFLRLNGTLEAPAESLMLGGGTRAAVQSGYGFLLDSLIGGGGMVRAMGSPLFLTGLAQALVSFVMIFLLRILLRRPWLAACVFVVIVSGILLQPPRYDLRRLLHNSRGTRNAADAPVRIPLLRLVGVPWQVSRHVFRDR